MPFELIADRPGHAVLRAYEEPSLQPDHIRIQSLFSSVKHGTELRGFRAEAADSTDRWDAVLQLHIRGEKAPHRFPMSRGNMCLGVVTEVGDQVTQLKVGDRVFGHMPLRETHIVPESKVRIAPQDVSPQGLMYWDPTDFAVGGVRDGQVRLGDRVAVLDSGLSVRWWYRRPGCPEPAGW
jgi:threonine dehydrogenase-like Zn-dependent dehydrogenase